MGMKFTVHTDFKLLPCPCCGGKPMLVDCHYHGVCIECSRCHLSTETLTPGDDKWKTVKLWDRVAKRWNRRPDEINILIRSAQCVCAHKYGKHDPEGNRCVAVNDLRLALNAIKA